MSVGVLSRSGLAPSGRKAVTLASPCDLSVTGLRPPQDSPSNKLLYAKEISTYKKMVEE